jgi:3-hydroxybutyryl-CoA dehydrogenase
MQVGIVGAGAMGSGIGRVTAASGHTVLLHDVRPGAAEDALGRIGASVERQVAKGGTTAEEARATLERLTVARSVEDLSGCDLVIEAVVEDLTVKQTLFAELESVVGPDCILATNTSSLSVGAVFRNASQPGRSVGMHFFNPAHVMKLVEVIPGPRTDQRTLATVVDFAEGIGKRPILARDTPGFIVNLAGRAYTTEALAIVNEGVASPAQVDHVMKEGFGFPLGPFALMDLTGMDVNYPVTENIFEHNFADPKLRSTWEHRYLFEAGLLGQKTGQGFYSYPGDTPPAPTSSAPAGATTVVLSTDAGIALKEFCVRTGLTVVEDDGTSPVLLAPLGEDCTSAACRVGVDPRRAVAVDLAFGVRDVVTLMVPPGADPAVVSALRGRIETVSAVEVVNDSPGFIAQRILAAVVNLGSEMAQRGVAAPADIDTAVRLGLRYPAGPLALADEHGPRVFAEILDGIHRTTQDARYRASHWLRRRAAADLPIHHPDVVAARTSLAAVTD